MTHGQPMSNTSAVAMQDIDKSFHGVRVLHGANLRLEPGEVHVLLGENGAGKSTLMKIMGGQFAPDAGTMHLGSTPYQPKTPKMASDAGVAMIHQELLLVERLTVAENIFLGAEPRRWGRIDTKRMQREARQILDTLNSSIDPDCLVSCLSLAEKQYVEIARALRRPMRVLVMDEPTASLSSNEIDALFQTIRTLRARGVAIVYISHRMDEIFALGDRVTVLRNGATVLCNPLSDVTPEDLVRAMIGRSVASFIEKRDVPLGDIQLRVDGVQGPLIKQPVSFDVRAGEVFGLAGLVGSGRTAVARVIFGASPLTLGSVEVGSHRIDERTPLASIRAGLGFVTEDRKGEGLALNSVGETNLTLATLKQWSVCGFVKQPTVEMQVQRVAERVQLAPSALLKKTKFLSGGNQQKVVLGKWLLANCRVLILDEPTRGIDVGAKAEIYKLLSDLVADGMSIVLISSDMPELLGLADRIGVMHDGAMQAILPREEFDEERIMRLALGLN